ncbi:hypothetical protein [Mesorhizobium sp. M0011]|uniref:hypothetical protein n=1 Tax=Mesorhizobium sp. M0011 TaxID=2956839 RepID=UPI00333AF5BA
MFHPALISHLLVDYPLKHLWQRDDSFDWRTANGKAIGVDIVTTYSDHCYTDSGLPHVEGCYSIGTAEKRRVFCPDRHARSTQLPMMINALASKPAATVSLTHRRNWMSFQLKTNPALVAGQRYYMFFNLASGGISASGRHVVRLHVESAYAKDVRIGVRRNAPFGRLVEETVFKP